MPLVLITRRLPARVVAPLEDVAGLDVGPPEGWTRDHLLARIAAA